MPKKASYKTYVIPSEYNKMEEFILHNKPLMMEQVISSIEYAVQENLPVVEVFKFNNSNFVVTLSTNHFLANLDNIFCYYLENEKYELCPRVKELEQLIKNKLNTQKIIIHEKTKSRR